MKSSDDTTTNESTDEDMWFDTRRNIDSEWAEVSLTTVTGDLVHYRIPRRTLFKDLDET